MIIPRKGESYIMNKGYQLMDRDPTEKYQTRIRDVLKGHCDIVSKRTTKLKGLVKLYKESRPMKPLANSIQTPFYTIVKIAASS